MSHRWCILTCVVLCTSSFWTESVVGQESQILDGKASQNLEGLVKPRLSSQAKQQLDRFLEQSVGKSTVPGMVAIVVSPHDTLYLKAAGFQNAAKRIPMTDDTVFRMASMTKPITSVAVMQLVEEGKLDLDKPASMYLPGLERPQVAVDIRARRPPATEFTIRQLLSHTAGYGYSFSHPLLAELKRATGEEHEAKLLVHDPGERWTYGCSTRVLGKVVEAVSGTDLDLYFRQRILQPLGMLDTDFRLTKERLGRLVTVHQRGDDGLIEVPNTQNEDGKAVGDYGLRSTARDYGRFLRIFLQDGEVDGTKVLAPDSIVAMTSNQIGDLLVETQPGARPKWSADFPLGAGTDKFGLGFQLAVRRHPSMRSPGSYSWAGIYNTHFWVDPQQRIAVVLLMQVLPFYDESCIELLRGFEAALYGHLN